MLGSRLLGVYIAAKGMTHLVASSLLLGHMFQVSRMPSVSSGTFHSSISAWVCRYAPPGRLPGDAAGATDQAAVTDLLLRCERGPEDTQSPSVLPHWA